MKNIRVPIALSEEQHQAIKVAAEKVGLGVSAFMRMAAIKEIAANAE